MGQGVGTWIGARDERSPDAEEDAAGPLVVSETNPPNFTAAGDGEAV
jgi:hypothetical protein